MVEEMYKEEFNDLEMNSKEAGVDSSSEDRREELLNPLQTQNHRRLREGNNVTESETTKPPGENHGVYLDDETVRTNQASYDDISELSSIVVRGNNNNNNNNRHVSLALELRHCESDGFSTLGGSHMRGDESAQAASLDYHCLETEQQERRRFSNPHLLHDFVV